MNEEAAELWDQLIAQGMSPDEATKRVAAQFGPPPTRDLSGIRDAEALGYAPEVRPESTRVRSFKGVPLGNQHPIPTIGPESNKASGQPEPVNPLLGMGTKALHGATGSSLDEVAGAADALRGVLTDGTLSSPSSVAERYRSTRDAVRNINSGFSREHPTAAIIAELLGSAGTGIGAGAAVRGAGVIPRAAPGYARAISEGLAAGGVGGGAAGLMGAEGGVEDRLTGLAQGAGLGAGLGLIGTAVSRPVAGTARRLGVGTNADEMSDELLIARLAESGRTPRGVQARASVMHRQGKPASMIDVAGPPGSPIDRLLRGARAVDDRASRTIDNVLNRRQAGVGLGRTEGGAAGRISEDMAVSSGIQNRQSPRLTVRQLSDQREADADQMYSAIRDIPVNDRNLVRFLRTQEFRNAYGRAERTAARRAVARDDETLRLPPLAELIDNNGAIVGQGIPLGVLDQVKRGLDDLLFTAERPLASDAALSAGGMGPEELGALREVRRSFVRLLDQNVGEYAQARNVFAGHTANIRATDRGRDFMKMDSDEIAELLEDMGQTERDFFRRSAFDKYVRDRVEKGNPNTVANRIAANGPDRERLRLLFPDDGSFNRFLRLLADEKQMAGKRAFQQGNSQTTDKLADMANLAEQGIGAVARSAASGSPGPIMRVLMERGLAARSQGVTRAVADQVARKATAGAGGDLQELQDVIAGLERVPVRTAERLSRQQARRVGIATGVGSATAPSREKKKQAPR